MPSPRVFSDFAGMPLGRALLFETRALRAVVPMRLDYELTEFHLPCLRFKSLPGV